MGEALFQEAYSTMIEKMTPKDLKVMDEEYLRRFPQMPLRDDFGAITQYSGGGFADEGFRSAGIPILSTIDAWKPANDVRLLNQKEGEVLSGYLGRDQGQRHPDDMVEHYADISQGKKIHFHASPPCQAFTRAQRQGTSVAAKTPEEMEEDRVAAMPLIGDALYTVEQMIKHPDIDLASWSLEEAPDVAKYLKENPHFLDKYVSPPFKKKVMGLLTNHPKLDAIDFGAPTTRGRTFIGEGWNAEPTHYNSTYKPKPGRLPNPSVLDFLPHLQREEEENKPNKLAKLTDYRDKGRISQEVLDHLMAQGYISQSGGINPGKGGASWRNINSKHPSQEGGPGTAFLHRKPLTSSVTGITHNKPSHMYNRYLTPQEIMMLQGGRPTYDLSPAEGQYWRKTNPRSGNVKSIAAVDQIIGNAVAPPVARAIGRSVVGNNLQRRLMDYN
jgi:site-specific DNA-cytosine methylase